MYTIITGVHMMIYMVSRLNVHVCLFSEVVEYSYLSIAKLCVI
jgi:hypothetical protein